MKESSNLWPVSLEFSISALIFDFETVFNKFSKCVASPDTEAITHVSVDKEKKWLAVCERCTAGNKGKFTIYDLTYAKKKKSMPEHIQDMNAYDSREFVASAFNHKDDRFIVTLTGEPDWQIFLWNWDREKLIAKTQIGCQGEIVNEICKF